ncbi:MAG: RNB domain-containing ribonuclease [Clostridia bacterium]|nr:RNB domain-containing ribonuclease [Clostridia bacterium]
MNTLTNVFPKDVIEQANVATKMRLSSYLTKRQDLRGKTVLSFADSNNSRTECAISVYRNGNTAWQLGVHICDVAEYVCEGSPIDTEARKRRGTVFNGREVINMLPDALIHGVCDLDSGNDKLALSVLLDIDSKGNLISINFEESVIRVAEKCVYTEIDHLGLAKEASSVLSLREKYQPYVNILLDMYELAAIFCNRRRERGGLDCTVFARKYGRDSENRINSLEFIAEPDTKAMVREILYYAAQSTGRYMFDKNIPCIYIGQQTVDAKAVKYLAKLTDCKVEEDDENSASAIADCAKGSPYYDFICETLSAALPCSVFSTSPIYNTLCGCEYLVSFVRPASRYADLLTQRMIKTCIQAKSNTSNLNLIRYKQLVSDAAIEASNAAKYIFDANRNYYSVATAEYLQNCGESVFEGFALRRNENSDVDVVLRCGAKGIILAKDADGFEFTVGVPQNFKLIGIDNNEAVVKPID